MSKVTLQSTVNSVSMQFFMSRLIYLCSKSVTKDINQLPKVTVSDELKTTSAGKTKVDHQCDIGNDGKHASAYCTDCGKLMCAHHEEVLCFILNMQ